MNLDDSLTIIKGVGSQVLEKFKVLGVLTIEDLLTNYPRKYEDFSQVVSIINLNPGKSTIQAKVESVISRYGRRGFHMTEAVVADSSGKMNILWFNQPYRAASIKKDQEYYISGDFGLHNQKMSMINPSMELVSAFPLNTARIIPIYSETSGLKSIQIRKIVKNSLSYLDLISESLPEWIIKNYNLIPLKQAIEELHFPKSNEDLEKARSRIAFEELFDLSLAAQLNKKDLLLQPVIKIEFNQKLATEFVSKLDFKLTDEQKISAWQILKDMDKDRPMNRLLEGDVGTGKTVVATMAAVNTLKFGYQVALMAPTEILAKQHYKTIKDLLKPLKMDDKVGLLVGSMKPKDKAEAKDLFLAGKLNFMIGTHSIIQDSVKLPKLAMVVIDEQHRFGVNQRQNLLQKTGHMPHLLSMSATPIPRSLQLALFGDLDVSIIKSKPYSDLDIDTKIISLNQRSATYEKLKDVLKKKEQIYVVCPLISESPVMSFRAVEKVYKDLSEGVYKDYSVGILHSRLSTEEKEKVMEKFVSNEINVLVCTTIIEVGVNVPNATTIVIESAERFGLAQIHQLRGRVGRNHKQGSCYLLLDSSNKPSPRLLALENTFDGFKLAELDLELRGPGIIYGTLQHGKNNLDLQIADLTDIKMILLAKKAAEEFIEKGENLLQYVQLNERINRLRAITTLN
ncbi:MAG TPA: ATP-dependent DNA helicase RecG [Candidatus Saccharimonadia bacterium]|nr:ATP-dependent DNA helicase RecG [Candidatus Saccharimonadia bacterium]